MSTVTILQRPAGPFTRGDLDALPDDGYRRELIDGVLVVSPAPTRKHQIVLANLHLGMAAACPADLRVLFAPVDVDHADDTVMQPDLLVVECARFGNQAPAVPLLAVEVLSPSTRRFDLTVKRSRFEAAGCVSYWGVDPDQPSITAWELSDRTYVEAARASGDETFAVDLPYLVELRPRDLLD